MDTVADHRTSQTLDFTNQFVVFGRELRSQSSFPLLPSVGAFCHRGWISENGTPMNSSRYRKPARSRVSALRSDPKALEAARRPCSGCCADLGSNHSIRSSMLQYP